MVAETTSPASGPARLAVIVLLGLVGAGGVAAANHGGRTHTFAETVTLGTPQRLVVAIESGNVTVETSAAGEARVTFDASWYGDRTRPSARLQGGVLRVRGCESRWWHEYGWAARTCRTDVRITVPEGTAIDLRSDRGTLDLRGRLGAVSATTDTGTITTRGLTGSTVRLRTDTGRITPDVAATSVDIATDTGDIEATIRATDARLATDTGSITAQLPTAPTTVLARTDTGAIAVTVLPERYRVDARTDTGRVQVDSRLVDPNATRAITATTDTGDVTVAALEVAP